MFYEWRIDKKNIFFFVLFEISVTESKTYIIDFVNCTLCTVMFSDSQFVLMWIVVCVVQCQWACSAC